MKTDLQGFEHFILQEGFSFLSLLPFSKLISPIFGDIQSTLFVTNTPFPGFRSLYYKQSLSLIK